MSDQAARAVRLPPAAVYVAAVAATGVAALLAALAATTPEELLAALTRYTARIAFCLFFVAFTTSVWLTWRATPATRWLMRNRRHVGLSFAVVHFTHLAVLSALFAVRGEIPGVVTLLGGGTAYVLLTALVLTSNRAARARLGRRWRLLHLTGCWYLWAIFTQSYLGRLNPAAPAEPYALFVVLTGAALAVPLLRTWAWARRRHRRVAAPASEAA